MDNLFTSYPLLSTLRGLGIGAVGTVRASNIMGCFTNETLDSNNGKILAWGEVHTEIISKNGGEDVLAIIWQDQKVVKLMSTVHDASTYIIRPRRRPKDTSSITTATRQIFDLPLSTKLVNRNVSTRFTVYKLALSIIEPIDKYNYNMNGVDRADQLRGELRTNRITSRNWLPYFFFLLDTSLINAYLLWRWEGEARVNYSRQGESLRTHRVFREAIIQKLLIDPPSHPAQRMSFDIVIGPKHQFRQPNHLGSHGSQHTLSGGMKRRQCYFCRYQAKKGYSKKVIKTSTGCLACRVPLCKGCCSMYHAS